MTNPTSATPLLSARHLTCIREERILFDELSFDIGPGDIVQIEGPNGSGKTSLLRILAGLSRPYAGDVLYQQDNIVEARDAFNADLLYFGHLPGVKSELTAEENLDFNLKISGYSGFNTREILGKVNLTGFEEAPAGHLSAGQHRRTALARLWNSDCRIWILDEPFTAIDKRGVAELEQMLLNHAAQGGCVIITTHQDLSLEENRQYKKIRLEYQYT
ncbi:cytochrome c biogenesis heme-transporting ATPase CcmA [Paraferrimonas sedimenticola]|uniref:Cytochrome c biogenesis ATP-binding export protein CcmA n=1 Tax=Paraferrimonas sedimenticola TaxID=375674 RepID=A0AA37RZD7_9GAMM|nr:cytochrome c biogenesis heme-transporting ATPase CcmA [Paraferrimonas sedimenticola]GLP97712.1 cytochrome c biogenesis ATP-binding export protein CcmA [Paraferrimonas sedimenticola]